MRRSADEKASDLAALAGLSKEALNMVLFDMLLIACCGYALFRGGAPERIVGAALAAAWLATLSRSGRLVTHVDPSEPGGLLIASLLLIVLVAVALRADRGWPLLIAGLQLAVAGVHFVSLFDSQIDRTSSAALIAMCTYPMSVVLAIGTWRHRRRLATQGYDLAWSIRGGTGREAKYSAG
jgi:hypothetical protein